MELSRSQIVPAPVDVVWAALNDPETLRGCVPGCDAIEPDGENAYRITMAAKVGPVSAKFAGACGCPTSILRRGTRCRSTGRAAPRDSRRARRR